MCFKIISCSFSLRLQIFKAFSNAICGCLNACQPFNIFLECLQSYKNKSCKTAALAVTDGYDLSVYGIRRNWSNRTQGKRHGGGNCPVRLRPPLSFLGIPGYAPFRKHGIHHRNIPYGLLPKCRSAPAIISEHAVHRARARASALSSHRKLQI